MKKSVMILT